VIWAFCATANFGDPWVSTNGGATFSTTPTYQGVSTNGASVVALSAQHTRSSSIQEPKYFESPSMEGVASSRFRSLLVRRGRDSRTLRSAMSSSRRSPAVQRVCCARPMPDAPGH
jgi:hypothetical protein